MSASYNILPFAQNGTYVKTTSIYSGSYYGFYATDPYIALIGTSAGASWVTLDNSAFPQKLNIDHGIAYVSNAIYLENFHHGGTLTDYGMKTFRVYGSNSSTAFNNIDGNNTSDLTLLGEFVLRAHVSSDVSDPQYFTYTNNTAYQYTIIIFLDKQNESYTRAGLKRVAVQSSFNSVNISESKYYVTVAYKDNKQVYPFTRNYNYVKYDVAIRENIKTGFINNIYRSHMYDFPEHRFIYKPERATVHKLAFWKNSGYPFTNLFGSISGQVKVEGTVFPNALVRLYYKKNGILLDRTFSDSDGNFTFNTLEAGASDYTVIAYVTGYNAIVYDIVKPI